ncbi:MAG TPA: recombinase family protein [Alphaproteobacteria bacterium]|nr:recombinase family protein [Alphaproteobacteria bacterium]
MLESSVAALDYIRDGDTLVVTKLDRLARSTADLLRISEAVERKGARLRILGLDLDTSTATGKLLLAMVGAIAAFGRELMLERQREGIAAAKAAGKYRGRKATARAKADQARALKDQGLGASEIAHRLGIGRANVVSGASRGLKAPETAVECPGPNQPCRVPMRGQQRSR